ncbi:hypothetical protein ACNOYE_39795 [Nannocystaceae bacterium ST9]
MPPCCAIPGNAAILAHLGRARPSAHSDLVDELDRAIEGLVGVQTWCPDPRSFAFVLAYAESGAIFAVAVGMAEILVRAPASDEPGIRAADPGLEGWSRVELFRGGEALDAQRARLRERVRAAWISTRPARSQAE